MLFNSYEFLIAFLPLAFFGYLVFLRVSQRSASCWLLLASFAFYSWWDIRYAPLLLASATVNYGFGLAIQVALGAGRRRQALLTAALSIATNILVLAHFKYATFLLSVVSGTTFTPSTHSIPLGISFFTFTQIAYLVDTLKGRAKERDPMSYFLFVTWFPHLIAGPLLHNEEMMRQFRGSLRENVRTIAIASGVTLLTIGLFKKVILADSIGFYIADTNAASPFVRAARGIDIGFLDGWAAALAYTCQIYFDFSGYSDMAIGISAIFGIKLPLNFNSPYKARNIAEFWRRWHITLSRFLRDYVYIPLGGNRRRHLVNLLLTMVIGGAWHGAGWTFVIWGALHGIYLVAYRLWDAARRHVIGDRPPTRAGALVGWAITFIFVVIAWVFFRAETLPAALSILKGMAGFNGLVADATISEPLTPMAIWIAALLGVAWFLPNSQEIMAQAPIWLGIRGYAEQVAPARHLLWHPTFGWSVVASAVLVVAVLGLTRPTQFLYFQF
jgi:alginate O-acetyltransferase complex protein AlgI